MVFVGSPEGLRLQTRDRVWEIEVSETEYHRLQASGKVVSSRRVPGGIVGRVVAADNPGGAGQPVEPDLQDAYIAAMEVVDHALVRHCGAGGVKIQLRDFTLCRAPNNPATILALPGGFTSRGRPAAGEGLVLTEEDLAFAARYEEEPPAALRAAALWTLIGQPAGEGALDFWLGAADWPLAAAASPRASWKRLTRVSRTATSTAGSRRPRHAATMGQEPGKLKRIF